MHFTGEVVLDPDGMQQRARHSSTPLGLDSGSRVVPWNCLETLCLAASVALQYFFIGAFVFCALEGIQVYCVATAVTLKGPFFAKMYKCTKVCVFEGPFFGHNKWLLFLGGHLVPIIPTAIAAGIRYYHYVATYSCWLNLGKTVSTASVIPILALSVGCVVLAEASGMGHNRRLPLTDRDQYNAAIINRKGLFILAPLSLVHWLMGAYAVYKVNVGMYLSVFILNVFTGIAVFVFHTMGNPKSIECFFFGGGGGGSDDKNFCFANEIYQVEASDKWDHKMSKSNDDGCTPVCSVAPDVDSAGNFVCGTGFMPFDAYDGLLCLYFVIIGDHEFQDRFTACSAYNSSVSVMSSSDPAMKTDGSEFRLGTGCCCIVLGMTRPTTQAPQS